VAGINFRPERAFLKECCLGSIVRTEKGYAVSADCTLEQQFQKLSDYFGEHMELTTHTFSHLTGLVGKKAYQALAQLVEKGYLSRMGQRAATHYVRTDKPLE